MAKSFCLTPIANYQATCRPTFERLESRHLLSAGPKLAGIELLGSADACTGVALTFDRSLDPAHATDARAYVVGRTPPSPGSSSSLIGDIFGFAKRINPIKHGKVQFASATYDDTSHSVTLVPVSPFKEWKYFRILRVRGSGPYALTDSAGNPFDGNGDGTGGDDLVVNWRTRRGKQIHYVDSDGDKVTIGLRGPGVMFVTQQLHGSPTPLIFIEHTKAKSVLSGTVIAGKNGNGIAKIAQLSGFSGPSDTILTNSQFDVDKVLP